MAASAESHEIVIRGSPFFFLVGLENVAGDLVGAGPKESDWVGSRLSGGREDPLSRATNASSIMRSVGPILLRRQRSEQYLTGELWEALV